MLFSWLFKIIQMLFNKYLQAGITILLIFKTCRCAVLVIQIPGNLGKEGSTYRFDYSPPHGYPPPNTTIAAQDIRDVIQFSQALPGTKYEFWLYYSNSTLNNWLTWTASITTAPDPPSNFSAVAQDGNSALISWTPPLQGYSTYHLKVVSLSEKNVSAQIFTFANDTYQYNLRGLKPGASYQIQAVTVFDSKESDTYASSYFTTKPNTPGKLIVWFRNETTLLVLWQPPYPAGIFTYYKVSIDPPDANESTLWVEKEDEPPELAQTAFKGLVPGRAYNISVQTMSDDEISAPTTAQYHTVPLRPLNVTFEQVTSTWFRVHWEPPSEFSEFDNYQVSLSAVNETAPVTRARDEPTWWDFYDNFVLGRKYKVFVKTVSGKVTSWPASGEITLQPLSVKKTQSYINTFEVENKNLFKISRNTFINQNVNQIEQILLSFNNITIVEETTFWDIINLKELVLSYNYISTLHPKTFVPLRSLKRLWLYSNNLEVLASNLFANLTSLELLHLGRNKIRKLDTNLFLSLSKLEVLNLSDNMIEFLDENIFSNLTTLRYMDLGFNQISYVAVGLFKNNPLETLSLIGNRLTVIDHIFDSLKILSALDVSENHIQELKNTTFNKLVFLKMLILSHNNITSIEKGTFDKLQKLESLHLGWNKLTELSGDLFKGLNSLKTLHLRNNKISHITDVFPESLTELHLHYNNLSTLNPSIVLNLKKLIEVSLENNPWFCDCRLGELYDYLVLDEDPICEEPQQFKNRTWRTLTPNLFACKPSVIIMISNMSDNKVQLSCKVIGSPEPRIQWIHKNDTTMEIIDSKNVDFQKYFAPDVDESYEYNFITWLNISVPTLTAYSNDYFCRATNSEGFTEERAMYNVQIDTMLSLDMRIFIGLSITVFVILFLLLVRRILLFKYVTTFT